MIQATLIQIDNYGPWTTHPQPRREAELQILQANIYAELQKLFSEKKALLFPMRCDNMLAVTNGLTEEDHKNIIKSFNGKHPVTISMAVATAETPLEAQKRATEELVKEGGAKHSHRKGVLKFTEGTKDKVRIAHIDINSITQHTDKDVYESYAKVIGTQNELMTHLAGENALLFFMGGDNFISVCNGLTKEKLET
ncbi:MAG: GTP cyclohydrolase IIa, partial [Candidatus Altiarchaeota archaeon]|nr:GTP cyclohydrolase IIa [Candidatus Altiarchaeota archaeon]